MLILVYRREGDHQKAVAFIRPVHAQLIADGQLVTIGYRNLGHWTPGEVEPCDLVAIPDNAQDIIATYEARERKILVMPFVPVPCAHEQLREEETVDEEARTRTIVRHCKSCGELVSSETVELPPREDDKHDELDKDTPPPPPPATTTPPATPPATRAVSSQRGARGS